MTAMIRAAVLLVLTLFPFPALAAPDYSLSVDGWASARSTHLRLQVDAYDPVRRSGLPLLQNLARLLPQGAAGLRVTCQAGGQSVTVRD